MLFFPLNWTKNDFFMLKSNLLFFLLSWTKNDFFVFFVKRNDNFKLKSNLLFDFFFFSIIKSIIDILY